MRALIVNFLIGGKYVHMFKWVVLFLLVLFLGAPFCVGVISGYEQAMQKYEQQKQGE